MQRKCRYIPLSRQPLVLVFGQVRFSSIRQMGQYIPEIQEEFRQKGFPIERAGKVRQFTFTPDGGVPVQTHEQQRWEYRTRDEAWSILVLEDSVVLQTTGYSRFEEYAEKFLHMLRTVFEKTEHDRLGVVQRVGLRYVDVVQPRQDQDEDFRFYLQPGFHGVLDDVFEEGTHRLHVESTGKTSVENESGTMIVRIMQNDQGFSLPPDLVGDAPKHAPRGTKGELITLIDMDHYIEGNFDPDADWIVERAFEMHDHLVETFHSHVVTESAIEVWK